MPARGPLFERALAINEVALWRGASDRGCGLVLEAGHFRQLTLRRFSAQLAQHRFCRGADKSSRRALAVREKVLGPERRDTAASLSNLGSNLDDQDRHAEAEPLLRRALAVYKRVLGPEQPRTAWTLFRNARHNLAMGDPKIACSMARQAHATLMERAGCSHSRTRTI